MSQLLVRNIPDETLQSFKRLARREGISTEALARRVIEREAGWEDRERRREAALRRMDELRAMTRPSDGPTTTEILRRMRDGDDEDR